MLYGDNLFAIFNQSILYVSILLSCCFFLKHKKSLSQIINHYKQYHAYQHRAIILNLDRLSRQEHAHQRFCNAICYSIAYTDINHKPKEFWIRLTERFQADDVDYEERYKNHKPTMEELQRQRDTEFEYEPLISILVPVYNTPEEFLKQMIKSVRKQTYGKWELCIANANPANETVAEILRISSTKDERIKVKDVPENVPTDPWLPCLHPNTIPSVCHFH